MGYVTNFVSICFNAKCSLIGIFHVSARPPNNTNISKKTLCGWDRTHDIVVVRLMSLTFVPQ